MFTINSINKLRLTIKRLLIFVAITLLILNNTRILQIEGSLQGDRERRKPYDSHIIVRSLENLYKPKPKTNQEIIESFNKSIDNSHSSTLVLVLDKKTNKIISTNKNTVKVNIPNKVIQDLLKVNLSVGNYTQVFYGRELNINKEYFHAGEIEYSLILITDIKTSIKSALDENRFYLALCLILIFLLFAAILLLYEAANNSVNKSIKASAKMRIPNWYPKELAVLAETINNFLEKERIAVKQIEQSTCGQLLVFSSLKNEATISKPNATLAKITGYSLEELEGMPLNQICPSYAHEYHKGFGVWSPEKSRHIGTNPYAEGCPFNHNPKKKSDIVDTGLDRSVEVIKKDGSIANCMLGVQLLGTTNNEHLYAGVLTDVSNLVTANKEITKMSNALRHDIISGVNGLIVLFNELRDMGFNPAPEFAEIYAMCEDRTRLVSRLVEGTGKIGATLKIQPTKISDILADLNLYFVGKNIAFTNLTEDPIINVDRDAIVLKVLANLITNAIKYSVPLDSEVLVGVKHSQDDPNLLILYVKDKSSGLTEQDIYKILNNFGQSARLRPEIEGTGTGLSTVQDVLKAHNLKLEVRSATGGNNPGSIFFIKIPQISN